MSWLLAALGCCIDMCCVLGAVAVRRFFLAVLAQLAPCRDAIKPSSVLFSVLSAPPRRWHAESLRLPSISETLRSPPILVALHPRRRRRRISFGWPAEYPYAIPKRKTPNTLPLSQLDAETPRSSTGRRQIKIDPPADHLSSYTHLRTPRSSQLPIQTALFTTATLSPQPSLLVCPPSKPYHLWQIPHRAASRTTPRLQWLGRHQAM